MIQQPTSIPGRNTVRMRTLVLSGVLLLGACSTGGPERSAATTLSLAIPGNNSSQAQRLQALETGLQQLTRRVEALQAAVASAQGSVHPAGASAGPIPVEYQPVRPVVVLADPPLPRRLAAPPAAAPAAPVRVPQPAPARQSPGRGEWVINLASYTSRSYATRKLTEFVDGGIAAEQVQAEVNGATVYRLRVPGFESYASASSQAEHIRAQLGLSETWVTRR